MGTIAAVALTWAFAALATESAVETYGGGLLLALVAALVPANLYAAGRNARRRAG